MSLLKKIKQEHVLGIFSKTIDSSFVEAAGYAGLDFVILDQEHGSISLETLHNHVRAAEISGITSIVRVKGVDANAIGSALDAGADGVQIPNITTAIQAEEAVKSARFYPMGTRGVCRFVRAANFGEKERNSYFAEANQKIVVLQVEGQEGVENLDSILEVKGFDILFIGPYDLSQSVGKPGQVNSSEVLELMNEIAIKAKAKNIALGVFCDTPENYDLFKSKGFKYIAYSVDVNLFVERIKGIRNE